uniref:Uncharacterized protein n=2 Tax=Araneus ventricosus TaxID=182803 RepID=A0A4Y2IP47_ARAVE|nr:hypothetical protein AVEN_164181-1 [Araneus ventricosus]GBM79621.1 hypothetical protein AVEN_187642-1 [Araneus ventricosus]
MAFLGKARKEDMIILGRELGQEVTPDLEIIDLWNLIVASTNYDLEFVKDTVTSQRTEEAEQRKRELESEEGKEKKGNSNRRS